jgi:hypothetical protein
MARTEVEATTRDPRSSPAGRKSPDGRSALHVAGAAGGVGTSTLALALGGVDRGVSRGATVDVLVCSATGDSVVRAAGAANLIAIRADRPPVLAVTALDRWGPDRAVRTRLRLIEPHVRAVVVVPHVRRWRAAGRSAADLRGVLPPTRDNPPRHLRPYLAAVREIRLAAGTTPDNTPRRARPAVRSAFRSTAQTASFASRSSR